MSVPSSSPPSRGRRLSSTDLDSSTAETQLFESIEVRRGRVRTASGEAYQIAVAGERPVLGDTVSFEEMYNIYDSEQSVGSHDDSDTQLSPAAMKAARRLKEIAKRAMQKRQDKEAMQRSARNKRRHKRSGTTSAHELLQIIMEEEHQPTAAPAESSNEFATREGEERPSATAAVPEEQAASKFFNAVGGQESELGESAFAVEDSQMDHLVNNALRIEKLLESEEDDVSTTSTTCTEDQLPLLGEESTYGTAQVQRLRERRRSRHRRRKYTKVFQKILRCFNPYRLLRLLWQMVRSAYFLWLAIPLFILAWICYYYFGNPKFDFMPGEATLSWWCNFVGRQALTLELARLTQFMFVDGLVLGSRHTVQWLGPLVTLWALQAKGWPLLAISWSAWDLVLLHGSNEFQTHWLYWTGIAIYSKANSGSYILSSDLYLRALLSLVLAGLAVSVKRATVAIYFGRRTFVVFKPRLEKILQDIVLLSDVADLADEAERLAAGSAGELPQEKLVGNRKGVPASKSVTGTVKWLSEEAFDHPGSHDDSASEGDGWNSPSSGERKSLLKRDSSGGLARNVSGSIRIKNMLDSWEEPINKLEKTSDATIRDILRFRRALAFMDDPRPFGETFGPAATRDECIESAHHVYDRLLRLTPDKSILSNDVVIMLAQEGDDTIDVKKRNALRKFIRPDRFNNIPLLAFVQTCDSLYRKLRYFRASVGNASVIDHALEKIIDGVYGFFLFLMILSLMNINPWPLLVSLSTLLVSFSFAMGASASKYIEGVLLIAVRRPYDLGDRIVFDNKGPHPGAGDSWFVEDINLFSTTLRYALTNEVATVNNGTISGERICNLNRSPNAVCVLEQPMHMRFVEKDCDDIFKAAVERYIVDHPRVWEALVNFRFNVFDADNEKIIVRLDVRHRNSWQDATRVLRDFGDIQRFIYNLGETMNVNFDSAPARRILYQGGILKSGQVEDYKISLYANQNIKNYTSSDASGSGETTVDKTVAGGSGETTVDKKVADSLFLAQLQKSNEPVL